MNTIINFLLAAAMQVLSMTNANTIHQISEEIQIKNVQQMEIGTPIHISNNECHQDMYQFKLINEHS